MNKSEEERARQPHFTPVEAFDHRPIVHYVTASGYYAIRGRYGSGKSRIVGDMRPRVVVSKHKRGGDQIGEDSKGLLLGVSLTGDGESIDPRMPPSHEYIQPIVIETETTDDGVAPVFTILEDF